MHMIGEELYITAFHVVISYCPPKEGEKKEMQDKQACLVLPLFIFCALQLLHGVCIFC